MDPYIYSPCGGLSKPPGIRNEGNICYITSILQCMLSVEPLKDSLCQAVWSTDNHLNTLEAFEELFIDLVKCCREPHYFCEKFLLFLKNKWQLYRPGEQEDCRTFLQFMLVSIHEETMVISAPTATFMKDTNVIRTVIQAWFNRERSPTSDLFGCMNVRQSFCDTPTCHIFSARCDPPSFYLTLNLPEDKKMCSLQECLRLWSSVETYTSDSKCQKCSTLKKRTLLKMGRLPPLLIIHLARFVYNFVGQTVSQAKNDCFVEYEHNLDMKEFVVDGLHTNITYSLVAVTCHSGGLASGHYTSFCNRDGRWFNCADSKVSSISAKRVITSGTYLLWYRQREDQPGTLPFDAPAAEPPALAAEPPALAAEPPALAAEPPAPEPPVPLTDVNSSLCSDSDGTFIMTSVEHSSDSQEFSEQDDERPPKKKLKSAGDREINIPPAMNSVKPTAAPKFQKGIEDTQACNHEIDLDVRDPILERKDVDGGDLDLEELINSYKRPELERLMRMYGLPVSSALKKPEIIDRITAHVARGKGEKVIPGFGAGYWHKRKRTKLIEENHIQTNLPMVALPGKAWSPFPSTHIPEGFHYLDILDYFEAIPEIDFSYKRGVVKHEAPEVLSLHHDSSGDEDEDDVEEDCHEMTFKNLCRRAIKKCLQKGEQFLAGGRLLCMMDTKEINIIS